MKIKLKEDWGCEDPVANEAVMKRAYWFIKKWNKANDWDDRLFAITTLFRNYENMYSYSYAKQVMRTVVANNVLHFACDIGETRGIPRDVIEGLWKDVFRSEIWEFTGSYSPFSKRQVKLSKT